MRTKQVIVSESGTTLMSPEDGVIVKGAIYGAHLDHDGNPYLGLIGNGDPKNKDYLFAYSWRELLEALDIPLQELRDEVNRKETRIRVGTGRHTRL